MCGEDCNNCDIKFDEKGIKCKYMYYKNLVIETLTGRELEEFYKEYPEYRNNNKIIRVIKYNADRAHIECWEYWKIEIQRRLKNKIKTEEEKMFKNMIIEDVEFNEVDKIAANSFLKTFALNNQKELNIEQQGEDFYMIKKGRSKKFTVDTIKDIVKTSMVGKKVSDVQSNAKLNVLVEQLNLIKKVVIVNDDEIDFEIV